MLRVIVCGGRDYTDRQRIFGLLDKNLAKIGEIIHGGARGADSIAGAWAISRKVKESVFPADWEKFGKKAGYLRNLQMIEQKPDLVVAFPGGVGTKMMMQMAWARKVRVIEVPLTGPAKEVAPPPPAPKVVRKKAAKALEPELPVIGNEYPF